MSVIKLYVSPTDRFGFVGDLHFDNTTPSSRLDDYMETCCKKLKSIGDICQAEGVRYLFFSGDIFHKVTCSHECVNYAGRAFISLQQKGIRVFSICGNHDLMRNQLKQICKSPIQTLFFSGVIEHVNLLSPVEIYRMQKDDNGIGSVKITSCDYTQVVPPADDRFDRNILLAHMFFNKGGFLASDGENIPKDVMESLGYDMAFLGHDHEEYKLTMCGKTLVVRSGSLLRGTVNDYNLQREPGFVIVDDIFSPQDVRKVTVWHRLYKDIISQAALNRKVANATDNAVDHSALRDLAEKLAEAKEKDSSAEDLVLKAIQTDPQVSDKCRKILLDYIRKSG